MTNSRLIIEYGKYRFFRKCYPADEDRVRINDGNVLVDYGYHRHVFI